MQVLAVTSSTALIISSFLSAIGLLVAVSSLRINAKRGVVDDLRTEVNVLKDQVQRCESQNKVKDDRITELTAHSKGQDLAIKALEDERAKARDREFNLLMEIHDLTKQVNELKNQ